MAFVVTKRSSSPLPEIGTWLTLSDEDVNIQTKLVDFDADVGFGDLAIIHALRIEYTSATGGTRPLVIEILDSASDVIRVIDLKVAAAGFGITTIYEVARGLSPPSTPQSGGVEHDTMPDNFALLPGQNVQVRATSGSDPADDLQVHALVQVF